MKKLIMFLILLTILSTVALAQPYSANQLRAQATTAALGVASDNQLKLIQAVPPMISSGAFYAWTFVFHSDRDDSTTIVTTGLMPTQVSRVSDLQYGLFGTIPATISESSTAYNNTLTHGGSAFMTAHPNANVMMMAMIDTTSNFGIWSITMQANPDFIMFTMNLVTGAFIMVLDAPEATPETPNGFSLLQNYPNPFNPSTTISFRLANAGQVQLTVFDAVGREVTKLVNGYQMAGDHTVSFEGAALPTGVYFYRLTGTGFVSTKQMLLVK